MVKNKDKASRIAIYIRVSTEEQAEQGYSIDGQDETLCTFCDEQGYEIVDKYIDRGISGKSMEHRLELQRMLKDVQLGKLDMVLVWKMNRLSLRYQRLCYVQTLLQLP